MFAVGVMLCSFRNFRMNTTKVEPESDPETQELLSEFQFIDVNQDVLLVPMPCTEMKAEIEVPNVEQTDSDSEADQFYRESEVMDEKEECKFHPPIYNIWKYKVQVKDMLETHEQMPNQQMLYSESMKESEWLLHKKREKFKELMRKRRKNETPDQRQKRLNTMKQYAKHRRATETPEQRQKRLSQKNIYARQRRANESLDQRLKRLNKMNDYEKQRRASESPEQREERRRKRREMASLRRHTKTPKERQRRRTVKRN